MVIEEIKQKLTKLTSHQHVKIVSRGNTAIKTVLKLFDKVLIPEEGGWLTYKKYVDYGEVKCHDAKIDLGDLEEKLKLKQFGAFLYHNPGGYFASEPMEEIYSLCKKYDCLVIMDVAGSIGTKLCDGNYADFIVGSFGRWKLVDAGKGGFISGNDNFEKLDIAELDDQELLNKILEKLNGLDARIKFLLEKRKKVINDLVDYDIIHKNDLGFVVIIKFKDDTEKENLINYCKNNNLEWTECPRYIRINQKAISIEIKRL
jgi:hypothetical protein